MSNLVTTITPSLSISSSQGNLNAITTTYNESGISYNQAGQTYGGFYGYSQVTPLISRAAYEPIPTISLKGILTASMKVGKSLAAISDQNLSYNQAGVSFNQSGYTYGGIYGFTQNEIVPSIAGYNDIYRQGRRVTLQAGQSMGLLLALTYPTTETYITNT